MNEDPIVEEMRRAGQGIQLALRRPWERDVKPAVTFTLRLSVH